MKCFAIILVALTLGTFAYLGKKNKHPWYEWLERAAVVIGLEIAVISLWISINTYQDAKVSGDAQLVTLEASRKAIETLSNTVAEQKRQEDLERQKKPEVEIYFAEEADSQKLVSLRQKPNLKVRRSYIGQYAVYLKNNGAKAVVSPVFSIISQNKQVIVWSSNIGKVDLTSSNRVSFDGQFIQPRLEPIDKPYRFIYGFKIPPGIEEFEASYLVIGSDMLPVERTIKVTVSE